LERAQFALKDASARRGVTVAGDLEMPLDPRATEVLDRDRQEAQQKLDEVSSRFTPEMLRQVKEVRETEKGERPTAMLGSDLYTDPSLLLDKDKYRAAIAESEASPEAKARAMADFATKRKRFADEALRTLRIAGESPIPGAQDFPSWEASQPEEVRRLTPEDKALQYMREMQDRGSIRKLTSAVGTGLLQGGTDIASQGLGVAAMIANSGKLAEEAATVAEGAQTLEEVQKLEGDKQATGATTLGGAARLVPPMAATIAPAALTGGAGLGVSSLLAGAQTAGAQFPNTYTELRKQGMSEQDALNASRNSAITSGLITAGLTAAFGKTGAEAALGAGAGGKELVKSRLAAAIKAVPKGAAAEIPEELIDEMASQVIEQRTIDPTKPVSQIVDEFAATAPDLAMQIALLGGVGGAVGAYRGSTTKPMEAEFPTAGAPPPLKPQDYENRAAGGQPIFNEEGDVIGVAPPGATPEETAAYREEIRSAAEAAKAAKAAIPEVVEPIDGVDPAITEEMDARLAAGKASGLADQTLAELERQKAAQKAAQEAPVAGATEGVNETTVQRDTDLFPDKTNFMGKLSQEAVLSDYQEQDGFGVAEYANPDTGVTDVYLAAFGDNDFIAYIRVYDENGKPTNRFTSKLERRSKSPGVTKKMLSDLQSRLPEGHEYTEDVSVSTDGLKFISGQLRQGYEVALDESGNPLTQDVAVSGESLVNDLPIAVNPNGKFDNIRITDQSEFNKAGNPRRRGTQRRHAPSSPSPFGWHRARPAHRLSTTFRSCPRNRSPTNHSARSSADDRYRRPAHAGRQQRGRVDANRQRSCRFHRQ